MIMRPVSILTTAFIHSSTRARSSIRFARPVSTISTLQSLFGGDFAGQYATFSPSNGKVINVPDHLVPEAMIEWGQIPSCLECLVSEDWIVEDDESVLERTTVTVLPETGCGIDNLETSISVKKLSMEQMQIFEIDNDIYQVGILFDGKDKTFHFVISTELEKDEIQRCRISIHLDDTFELDKKRPIEVVRERKTSKTSSKGSAGKRGGGLYGSTVMELVGKEHINHPFSDQEGVDVSSLNGYWYILNDESNKVYWDIKENVLSIPGGFGSVVLESSRIPVLDSNAAIHSNFSLNFILNQNDTLAGTKRIVADCSILQEGTVDVKVYGLYQCKK